jgi:hypothetical protein
MTAEVLVEEVEAIAANPVESANTAPAIAVAHVSMSARATCGELLCGIALIATAQLRGQG